MESARCDFCGLQSDCCLIRKLFDFLWGVCRCVAWRVVTAEAVPRSPIEDPDKEQEEKWVVANGPKESDCLSL